MANELVPMGDLEKMARAIASSKLFGVVNPEQALALMLVAQSENLHPATVAKDYHIINGRPALKADAMLARYLLAGGKVEWGTHTDEKVSATFSHPQGGTLTIDWDMARAKKAGLGGKDMWAKYPRQMLRARVISEGIRATNPGLVSGIYTPEEMQDIRPDGEITQRVSPKPRTDPKDMGTIDADTGEILPTKASGTDSGQPARPDSRQDAAAPLAPSTVGTEDAPRTAERTADASAIAECFTEKELEDVFKALYANAKGDNERRRWLVEMKDIQKRTLADAVPIDPKAPFAGMRDDPV